MYDQLCHRDTSYLLACIIRFEGSLLRWSTIYEPHSIWEQEIEVNKGTLVATKRDTLSDSFSKCGVDIAMQR